MTKTTDTLRAFLDIAPSCALVEVAEAKGSTPRDKGTWMLVTANGILGTIGGGQLEYMAIDKARMLLEGGFSAIEGEMSAKRPEGVAQGGREGSGTASTADLIPPVAFGYSLPSMGRGASARLSIPLGPEIGQCCGGRVDVTIRLVDDALKNELLANAESEDGRLPHVYLFGAGHVGHALALAFALLPVRTIVVETRAEALEDMPDAVETRLTPMPEDSVRRAPAGSVFLVLTHDHALDFLIVAEALKRDDAAYVGMIGSQTKKATFKSWFLKSAGGTEAAFARLVSPIGGDTVKDKRPAVIAALAAAEVMTALAAIGFRSSPE